MNKQQLDAIVEMTRREIRQRAWWRRGENPPAPIRRRTTIVVDDGLAIATTMFAGIRALCAGRAPRIVAAILLARPVGSPIAVTRSGKLICMAQRSPRNSTGTSEGGWPQVGGAEVAAALSRSNLPFHALQTPPHASHMCASTATTACVTLRCLSEIAHSTRPYAAYGLLALGMLLL